MSQFNFEVSYKRQNNSTGAVLGCSSSKEEAEKDVQKDIVYFLELGYTITSASFYEACESCGGSGNIYKRKKKHFAPIELPCKPCKRVGFLPGNFVKIV